MDGVKVTIHASHTIRSCGFAGHPPECPGYGSGEHAERIIDAFLGHEPEGEDPITAAKAHAEWTEAETAFAWGDR